MAGMIPVKNTSDKHIVIWYGHTPYPVHPGGTEQVPKDAYEAAKLHNDFKDIIIHDNGEETIVEVVEIKVEPAIDPQVDKFWEVEDWDPNTMSPEQVQQYASANGLIVDVENDFENSKEIAIEHFISN